MQYRYYENTEYWNTQAYDVSYLFQAKKTKQVRNIHAGSVEFTGAFRKDLLVGYSVLKSIAFDQNEHVFGRMN